MTYHEVRITNKATKHTWVNRVYAATMAEAVTLTAVTFGERLYVVEPANARAAARPEVKPAVQEDLF